MPRMSRMVRSRSATACSSRPATSGDGASIAVALQLQPGGEEPLDHAVVQVAGDPLAVGDDGELLAVARTPRPVQRQRRLVGEGDQQLALLDVPARWARSNSATRTPGSARWARSGIATAHRPSLRSSTGAGRRCARSLGEPVQQPATRSASAGPTGGDDGGPLSAELTTAVASAPGDRPAPSG